MQHRQASQFFYSAGQKKFLSPLSVQTSVRVRVSKKWIPGVIQSVCTEHNSYVVSTNCGRLFRRNQQAINLNKALDVNDQQQQQQQQGESPRSSSYRSTSDCLPSRLSINFVKEWQSPSSVCGPLLLPTRTSSVSSRVSVSEEDITQEDFMEAFHGFEASEVQPLPPRSGSRPGRSHSTSRVDPLSVQPQGVRSSSVDPSSLRVTRSGLSYGVRLLP